MTAILKVDTIQDTSGNNIINESSDTITIGASGDTTNIVGTLQNNGAAISSGLNLIKSVTASGASSVEFKNGVSDVVIDNTYSNYRIIGFNIVPSENDKNILIRFSTDGGSSYITSGYDTLIQRNIAASLNSGLSRTDAALFYNNVGNNTNEEGSFDFTVFNPSSSSFFTHYQSMGITRNADANVTFFQSGGIYEATSAIDAFQILFDSGNISGTFKLYGIK